MPAACRVGLWGTFDREGFGHALAGRVARREVGRRLPTADVRCFAPYGHLRPVPADGGEPAEPLGTWDTERLAALAGELDAIVVVGEVGLDGARLGVAYGVAADDPRLLDTGRFLVEGLGPDLEDGCPMAWLAVGLDDDPAPAEAARLRAALGARALVTVRDEASRRRLEAADVEREVGVVGDPTLLLARLFPASLLEKRLAWLRLMGWYPADRQALLVHAGRSVVSMPGVVPTLVRLIEDQGSPAVVVAELGPDEADGAALLAEELAGATGARVRRLPPVAAPEDVVAAVAAAAGLVGSSLHAAVAAACYGRPQVMIETGAASRLAGLAQLLGRPGLVADRAPAVPAALASVAGGRLAALQAGVDGAFDRVAELAEAAAGKRAGGAGGAGGGGHVDEREARMAALRRAHEIRGERLVAERAAFADQVSALEAELDRLRRTRTFRWTAPGRAAYRRLRTGRRP